jgi:hypothetical protein
LPRYPAISAFGLALRVIASGGLLAQQWHAFDRIVRRLRGQRNDASGAVIGKHPGRQLGVIDDPKTLDAMPLKLTAISLRRELMFPSRVGVSPANK